MADDAAVVRECPAAAAVFFTSSLENQMLKLNASFSKKIPAAEEYSSQSYHAAIEAELPDGLTPQQLQERIHGTFLLVRNSVEAELAGTSPAVAETPAPMPTTNTPSPAHRPAQTQPASTKQINYLILLGRRMAMDAAALNTEAQRRFNVPAIEQLTKRQASEWIESLNGRAAA
jgi:hypothetical protein